MLSLDLVYRFVDGYRVLRSWLDLTSFLSIIWLYACVGLATVIAFVVLTRVFLSLLESWD